MQEKIVNYGTEHTVKVISSSRLLIAVHATDINEGFLLTWHGLKVLPKEGDTGRIVFVRDDKRGHWHYYP